MEEPQKSYVNTMDLERDEPLKSTGPQISVSEFSCHCCYDILVNPTTLNCGHSFCRHCLALWWASSKKTECPECREKWEGFPKVNILLRWSCSSITGAARNLNTTSWSTRLWPNGRRKKLSSGWSSWALGHLFTGKGFYLNE
ncbi:BFAR isoform 8 [Pan troglodytes]|uniref:BFAR isoform 8 n=1 Tax=Pan troglodytes TaxID=9598 RepID=A0A2J8JL57_PANTR|nr:BFAR isoform 8 [Pan troglodytes]